MAEKFVLEGKKVNVFGKAGTLLRVLTLEEFGKENYGQYRKMTGQCETCGQAIKTHTQCKSCTILTGLGHLESYDNNGYCDRCISEATNA